MSRTNLNEKQKRNRNGRALKTENWLLRLQLKTFIVITRWRFKRGSFAFAKGKKKILSAMSGDGVSGAHLCSETYVSHPGQVRKKEHTCVEVQQSATGGRGDIGYEIC